MKAIEGFLFDKFGLVRAIAIGATILAPESEITGPHNEEQAKDQ